MSEKTKQKRRLPSFDPRCIVTLVLAVVIFCVNFRIVGKCYHPFVYNDEMGYWMHAAEMSGLDWRGVSYTVAWYSYGYSLMLVPLMKLFSDTVVLYRAALILNILMDEICYFMYVYIIRRLFPKLELITASVAAAAGILYTSYQFNSGVAFSETALLFAATLVVFLTVRILEKPTYLNTACLGLACAYMYMVHNRTIGIVASAVFVMASALICKKVKLRQSGAAPGPGDAIDDEGDSRDQGLARGKPILPQHHRSRDKQRQYDKVQHHIGPEHAAELLVQGGIPPFRPRRTAVKSDDILYHSRGALCNSRGPDF